MPLGREACLQGRMASTAVFRALFRHLAAQRGQRTAQGVQPHRLSAALRALFGGISIPWPHALNVDGMRARQGKRLAAWGQPRHEQLQQHAVWHHLLDLQQGHGRQQRHVPGASA